MLAAAALSVSRSCLYLAGLGWVGLGWIGSGSAALWLELVGLQLWLGWIGPKCCGAVCCSVLFYFFVLPRAALRCVAWGCAVVFLSRGVSSPWSAGAPAEFRRPDAYVRKAAGRETHPCNQDRLSSRSSRSIPCDDQTSARQDLRLPHLYPFSPIGQGHNPACCPAFWYCRRSTLSSLPC